MGALGARDLVPSDITYELKINSRKVQGERIRAAAQQENGSAEGGADNVGETQGGRGRTVNGASRLKRGRDRSKYLQSRGQM